MKRRQTPKRVSPSSDSPVIVSSIDLSMYDIYYSTASASYSREFDPPSLENSDLKPSTSVKLVRNQCPSTCLVCRNPAVGHHYDIPSCNGCKTFFRRSILNESDLKCSRNSECFDGTSPIDMSRRTCRSCRLKKCIKEGMNPLAINWDNLTDSARKRIEKILEKRAAHGFVANSGIVTAEDKINRMIEKLSFVETKTSKVHTDGIPEGFEDIRSLREVLTSRPLFSNKDIPNLVKRGADNRSKTMDYFHSSFLAVLEYSKTFDFAKKIDLEDKLILIKHVTVMCANMINAFFTISNFQSDRLILPDGTVAGADLLEIQLSTLTPRQAVQKTLQILIRNRLDRVEYMLLKAIIMCNPAVSNLSERTQRILDAERQNFAFCLLKYCRLQYGAMGGPGRYTELLAMVPGMEYEVQRQKSFHTYVKVVINTTKFKERIPFSVTPTILFGDVLES